LSASAIDAVVFDLDGTLGDTSSTCATAWNRVRDRHGIAFRTITEHDVKRVTGKPHEQCIRQVFIEGGAP
jgi:beta-phosphoglucomutase-like phosphatase (HAD superfamily)